MHLMVVNSPNEVYLNITERKWSFVTCPTTQFSSYKGHLQFHVFLHLESYQMSYINCPRHVITYVITKYMQLNYK